MQNHHQIVTVNNFQELVSTPLLGELNAVCWKRNLIGNFQEIVSMVEMAENIIVIGEEELLGFDLTEQGDLARKIILNDLKLLGDIGADPVLNVIKSYDRDDLYAIFPTDVYSFHVDRSPIASDTFLVTYHGASSDILPNSHAIQKVLIPGIRKELLSIYGGDDDADFEEFLSENFLDLHYQPIPMAEPINLGIGHLWRLATDHPESQVLPCVHRAPIGNSKEHRLLLIC